MAMKPVPCVITIATPAGIRMQPMIWSQPGSFASPVLLPVLDFCQRAGASGRHEPVVEPEQKQQDAAEQVEMGVCGLQRKILADAHGNPKHLPQKRMTTLTHIINDPIMRTSFAVGGRQCKPVGRGLGGDRSRSRGAL
jgi:hypothetical protein